MSSTTVFVASSSANAWLIGPRRPNAAMTAVSPSSTGTSAATTAPKAKRSTSRVTGTESSSARRRSLLTTRSRASLAETSPVSSTSTCACAPPAARTDARKASTAIGCVHCPETTAVRPSRASSTWMLPSDRLIRVFTSRIAARNAGAVVDSVSLCRYPYSRAAGQAWCSAMRSYPRADSPTAPLSSDLIPLAVPTAAATTTKASQTAIARQGRRALHLPMLATERKHRVYAARPTPLADGRAEDAAEPRTDCGDDHAREGDDPERADERVREEPPT